MPMPAVGRGYVALRPLAHPWPRDVPPAARSRRSASATNARACASVMLDEWGCIETSRAVIFARATLRDISGAGRQPLALDQTS